MSGRASFAWFAVVVASSLLQGVAIAPVAAQDAAGSPVTAAETDRLRERAAAFWAARIAGDSKAQWDFLEPRGQARITPGEYIGSGPIKYLAYQVEDATVQGYFATVKVRLLVQTILPTARPRDLEPFGSVIMDRWVRIGGVWYRSLEQEKQEAPPR